MFQSLLCWKRHQIVNWLRGRSFSCFCFNPYCAGRGIKSLSRQCQKHGSHGFNPYCAGRGIKSLSRQCQKHGSHGFNPYCAGRGIKSTLFPTECFCPHLFQSLLCWKRHQIEEIKYTKNVLTSFNPYCAGRGIKSGGNMCLWVSCWGVSILIVLEEASNQMTGNILLEGVSFNPYCAGRGIKSTIERAAPTSVSEFQSLLCWKRHQIN